MGSRILCSCKACGYRGMTTIGGGRSSFLTRLEWPVLCRNCKGLTSTNLRSEPLTCEDCASADLFVYGEKAPEGGPHRAWLEARPDYVEQCYDWFLFERDEPCPNCGSTSFRFGPTLMLFD